MNTKKRNTAVFYTSGICNLSCKYCNIDKNPALYEIDKALEESFKGDYYFNKLLEYFPNEYQLKKIETWGGEPFLFMERIYPLLIKIIEHYPYFNYMYSSTNFSFPSWNDKFFNLMKIFGNYPDREFVFQLQLSCDGPEYINDSGRGKGTTKKCIENFNIFVDKIENNVPSNIQLLITVKPTLDISTIPLLNNKKKIVEYYSFFEETFIKPIREKGFINVKISCPIPNVAVPCPATKKDGINFAKFCKDCSEIEKNIHKYLNYYEKITPYIGKMFEQVENLTYKSACITCGTGEGMVGFLPYDQISVCNEGFTNLVENYKNYIKNSKREEQGTINFNKFLSEEKQHLCFNENDYKKYETHISLLKPPNSTAQLSNLSSLIMLLALTNQIEEKYKYFDIALKGAKFIQSHTSTCVKDNYNESDTIIISPVGLIRLLLNGAQEYIEKSENY